MSTYGRVVHKIAATYWAALSVFVLVYAFLFPDAPWYVFWSVVAAFAIVEAWALRNRKRVDVDGVMIPLGDSYSEVVTWFARFSSDDARWYQWTKGAIALLCLCWGWIVAHQPTSLLLGIPAGALVAFLLYGHWVEPGKVNRQFGART